MKSFATDAGQANGNEPVPADWTLLKLCFARDGYVVNGSDW